MASARSITTSCVSSPKAPPKARRKSIGHADDQGDVRALQARPSARGEEQLVVGGHAAAGQAVEEHGDAELLGELEQRVSPWPQ
jgi:hypothetical protein